MEKGYVGNVEYLRRTDLEAEISAQRTDAVSKNIQKLIDCLIEDYRLENDTATVRAVMRNQGKIASLNQLKDIIVKDFASLSNKA